MAKVPLGELPRYAREVLVKLEQLPPAGAAAVVFLRGELGSGKTTFMQALGKALGIEAPIQSPTYVLMRTYELEAYPAAHGARRFAKLIHIDVYRLESPKEFSTLKPEEFLGDPEALVCIEWPERVEAAVSKPDLTVTFSSEGMGEGEREISVE